MNSNLMNPEEYSLELEILKLSLTLNTEVYENDQLALILRKSGIATNN
ncbi:hypothetical protein [Cellulophaga tyrosinoxydans]|nr:hypothetical protein [Cellulophaga tyrosinoxydans]